MTSDDPMGELDTHLEELSGRFLNEGGNMLSDTCCTKCGVQLEYNRGFWVDPSGHAVTDNAGVSPCCGANMAPLDEFCPECEQHRPDDDRVKAEMKCGQCAYGVDKTVTNSSQVEGT